MPDELQHSTGISNPLVLLQTAIEKGIDPDKLGKLLDLQERWERNRAAEAFATAIQAFQASCPPVVKGNPVKNKSGEQMYSFANLDDVMHVAQPLLTRHGIVVTWDTSIEGQAMKTTCNVRVGTHVERTSVTLAIPAIPNANATQMAGGALAYGKRYSVCAALGIQVTGEDNDAADQFAALSDEQVSILNGLFDECRNSPCGEVNKALFFPVVGCTDLNDMPASAFPKAVDLLHRKLKKGGGK